MSIIKKQLKLNNNNYNCYVNDDDDDDDDDNNNYNNNENFICVFECTIVNHGTYRQFTNAAWDWIIKKKKNKNKNKNKKKTKTKQNKSQFLFLQQNNNNNDKIFSYGGAMFNMEPPTFATTVWGLKSKISWPKYWIIFIHGILKKQLSFVWNFFVVSVLL